MRVARYDELRREQQHRRETGTGRRLGIGVAVYVESTAAGPAMEFGTVTVNGGRRRVVVRTGSSPHGQGHVTTWSMIASELLGSHEFGDLPETAKKTVREKIGHNKT